MIRRVIGKFPSKIVDKIKNNLALNFIFMRTWRHLIATITTSLIGLFLVSAAAQAETIAYVQMPVIDPSGNPVAEGLTGELVNSAGEIIQWPYSNDSGYLNFTDLEEGEYTLTILPSQSYTCSSCSLYESQTITFTASLAEATDDFGFTVQLLDTVQMTQASRFVTVTVVDQDGAPAEGLYVSGWTNDGAWAYGSTDENGQFQFAVDEDSTAEWALGAYPLDGGYTSTYEYDVEIAATGETEVTIEVVRADATIAFDIVDADGNPFTLGESDYASINCYDSSYTNSFYKSVTGGESSVDLGVVGGYTYQCSMWIDGYGSSSTSVTVETGQTVEASIQLLDRDAQATFQYVDDAGNVLTDVDSFSVYAFSTKDADGNENYSDYTYENGADGQATLDLVDGYTYQVSGYIFDSGSGLTVLSGTTYISSYEMHEIVADTATPQTVQVTLQEADATLNVSVLDVDGDAAEYAYVYAIEDSTEEGMWGAYIGESTDMNGSASMGVASGTNYTVYAYTMDSYVDGVLPPAAQHVTLGTGETESLTMQSIQADHTLSITTEISEPAASDSAMFDYAYCYAYSPDLGSYNYTDLSGNSGTMDLVSNYEWWIGCMSYQGNDFYRSNDTAYTPTSGEDTGTMSISMDSAGAYYPETSYSFSATAATTITLPDGLSTLTVPANAIDDSGNVTLIVQTGTGYVVNDDSFPLAVYEFTAIDSDGNEVTDFSTNLTLNLWYDESLLAEYGMTESDLVGSAYNDTNKQWEAPVSTSLDAENDMLVITLSHFSLYGGIGDRGLSSVESVPNKATKLKATKVKRSSAVLTWKKPSGTITKYKVQLRKQGVEKAANWKKYNSVKKVKKTVKKLKADTKYQFRVKACNADGCSGFTKWKAFTTKG